MKPNKPYVLGLTGGIACGKSYVARLLRQRGIPVLDADAISRSLTAPGGEALPAVRAAFGPDTALLVKASHAMHMETIVKELEAQT